jgi:hypothetical protein
MPQIYCQHTSAELEKTPLPGDSRYSYGDSAISILIENMKRMAKDGKNFNSIAWHGFQKAHGVSANSCKQNAASIARLNGRRLPNRQRRLFLNFR